MRVPHHIGRYPVKRLLGSGAMGSVYLALDTELDRSVAIKTVHPRLIAHADSGDILERLRNEARAVARVRHPSIVEVYDVGKDAEAGPFLVFEYVEGQNLKELLREHGPLTPALVIALAEQVGDALSRAHAADIIHRDIKPENLLVGGDGRTRLLDFGVARLPDAVLTGEGQFLGTPAYAAPETLSRGDYSPRSDQFSLSAVLFESVSGRRAFLGDDALAVAHAVIHDEAPLPSDCAPRGTQVPQAVDQVILRGLSKQENERFDDVHDLVEALRAAYAGEYSGGSDALADTVLQRALRAKRAPPGRRWAWPLAALATLGAGSFLILRFIPSAADAHASGAVLTDAEGRALQAAVLDASQDAAVDADAGPVEADAQPDATTPDAAQDAARVPTQLNAFEREELAKDALDRARSALERGDAAGAEAALAQATQYDPEHPDIALLQRRLRALRP